MNVKKSNRVVIVFEARGSWVADRYMEKIVRIPNFSYLKEKIENKDIRRIYTDSPLWNVIDAARITAKALEREKEVIAIGIVDSLVPIIEYNLPMPLYNKLKELGLNSKEIIDAWASVINLDIQLTKSIKDIREYYKEMGKAHPGDDKLHRLFTSHAYQMVTSAKGEWVSQFLNRNSPFPIYAPVFDIELTVKLFRKVLEMKKLDRKAKENLNLIVTSFPSPYFPSSDPTDINRIFSPLIKSHNKELAMKKYKLWLSPFVDRDFLERLGNSSPIIFPVDSYIHSASIISIKKNNLEISLRSKIPLKEIRKNIRLSTNTFGSLLSSKIENGEPILIKYPLIIIDYVGTIINSLKMDLNIDPSEIFANHWAHNLKRSTTQEKTMKDAVDEMVDRLNSSHEVDQLIFVEGEPEGINIMTGSVIERVFSYLAEKLKAAYTRVGSIRREEIEPKLKQLSISHFLQLIEKEGFYVMKDREWYKSNVDEIIHS